MGFRHFLHERGGLHESNCEQRSKSLCSIVKKKEEKKQQQNIYVKER